MVGIALGIAIGIVVIVGFLVYGSEDTIDSPSIHGVSHGAPAPQTRPLSPIKE